MNLPNQAGMTQAGPQLPDINPLPGLESQMGAEMPAQFNTNPPLPEVPEQEQEEENLQAQLESVNLADELDDEELVKLGMECKDAYNADLASRSEWEQDIRDWIKLATQVREHKNWPWTNASNVKFPLVGIAAMQFSARAYPSLVPSNGQIVSTKIYGKDPDQVKTARALRVSRFLSWQILEDMDNWEEDMDKLLIQLSITGLIYKKTFYDPEKDKLVSKLVDAADLVVNYWTKDLESAERISERFFIHPRVVKERQRMGLYRDVDLGDPIPPEEVDSTDQSDVKSLPFEFVEQHCWKQIGKDKFEKPYVVTFEKDSGTVLRIAARFDLKKVTYKKGKPIAVGAYQYYTKYGFIPNPDGSFYELGFGHLLGPLNEAVNTLTNQLVDAGTISNLNAGFIGKGLRIRGGELNFKPGEWKWVNATVDDLKKQILPLPAKEPSATLFNLLQYLVGAGKELASIAEIFVGKMPGQNTPATTTQSSIEQGMKVFTAIYKRVYRSMTKEFKKLYRLNSEYLDPNTQTKVLDDTIGPGDFNTEDYDIYPAADPTASSSQEKNAKNMQLVQLLSLGTLDPIEVTKRLLEDGEYPDWQKLIPGLAQTGQAQIPQQQDPKMVEMQLKMQAEQQKGQIQAQQMEHKMHLESASAAAQLNMKEAEHRIDMQAKAQELQLQKAADEHKQRIFMVQQAQGMQAKEAQHTQSMVHNEQKNRQSQRHAEAQASSKIQSQKATSKTGSKTPARK